MQWLIENLSTIIVSIILVVIVIRILKSIRKKGCCNSDCGGCSSSAICHSDKKSIVDEYHTDHKKSGV